MKKIWMFLLGAAFAAELFLVVCMASRSASPRQVKPCGHGDVLLWHIGYGNGRNEQWFQR